MVKKRLISRKEFVTRSLAGIAGLGISSGYINGQSSPLLNFHSLGKTGLRVTSLCFGATRTSDESLVRFGIASGINFIDTGRSYANGNNEKLVGRAVSGIRDKIVIQSKIGLTMDDLSSKGKGKKGAAEIRTVLTAKLEASLEALNTSYIDIMLYHDASDEKLLYHAEVMRLFSEWKKNGIIRACGFSTHNDMISLLERNNSEKFYDTVMIPFNHKGSYIHSQTGTYAEWDQEKLVSVLAESEKNGIGVVAMKTCSGGKFSPHEEMEPGFREAVKWVVSHSFISSAAVAIANVEQINEFLS